MPLYMLAETQPGKRVQSNTQHSNAVEMLELNALCGAPSEVGVVVMVHVVLVVGGCGDLRGGVCYLRVDYDVAGWA